MEKRITNFINFLYKKQSYNNFYLYPEIYSRIIDTNRKKIFIKIFNRKWLEYNFYVANSIIYYINKLYSIEFLHNDVYRDNEPIFLKLLYDIVIHNADNIRYDLTLRIICDYDSRIAIIYLEKHGLIYLLSRINPNTLNFLTYSHEKEKAECIYDLKLGLQMAWLGAVVKASKGNI